MVTKVRFAYNNLPSWLRLQRNQKMGKNTSPKAPKTTVQTINTSAAKGSSKKGTRTNGG
jgi:hypothetical protein